MGCAYDDGGGDNGDASPPNVKTMSLIARQAFEIDEYIRIADILHKEVRPLRRFARFDRRQWREKYKALHLLEHGPRSVASEFHKEREIIGQMATFQHIDEKGFNWGLTVKSKSELVLKLLERGPFLEEERERARKIAVEIKGFGCFNLSSSSSRAQLSGEGRGSVSRATDQCYGRSNSWYEDRWRNEDGSDGDKEDLVSRPDQLRHARGVAEEEEERHHHHPFHGFGQQHQILACPVVHGSQGNKTAKIFGPRRTTHAELIRIRPRLLTGPFPCSTRVSSVHVMLRIPDSYFVASLDTL